MTKKAMIKELVIWWVWNADDEEAHKNRFINHDWVESRLDQRTYKETIQNIYNKVFYGNAIIENLILDYADIDSYDIDNGKW